MSEAVLRPISGWRVFVTLIVAISVAIFASFFMTKSSIVSVPCGAPQPDFYCLAAAVGGARTFTDYLYAVMSLILAQLVLPTWILRRSRWKNHGRGVRTRCSLRL